MSTTDVTVWAQRLAGRDPEQSHRASTPLELFFDLTFVVAIAAAAANLHHGLSEGHWGDLGSYVVVFFGIWWAWMGFTWFSSAYDTDDVLWRVLTLVVMAGVLVLAAGVPRAFTVGDYRVLILGYVIMRVPMIVQWLRAAHGHPECRRTGQIYGYGIGVLQIGWLLWAFAFGQAGGVAVLLLLIVGELLVPPLAEREGATPWHPEHMVERYGLMTIIVLGEVLLSTTGAFSAALQEGTVGRPLVLAALGGLLVVFCLWWFYFKHTDAEGLAHATRRDLFVWGYGHYVAYAAIAAVGVGLGVCIDVIEHVAHVSSRAAALTLGAPVAAYLVVIAIIQSLTAGSWRAIGRAVVTATAVLAVCLAGWEMGLTVLLVGLVLVAALAFYLADRSSPGA